MMNREWLFITGPARSGTTVATMLMSLHRECHITQEIHWVQIFKYFLLNKDHYGDKSENIKFGFPNFFPALTDTFSIDELTMGMIDGLRRACGNPRVFGDKSPNYSLTWRDVISTLGGDIRWIVMDRDNEETIASLVRQEWCNHGEDSASEYVARVKEMCKDIEPQLVTRLENLKAYPVRTIEEMLDFARLDRGSYPFDQARKIINGPPVS